MGKDNDVIIRKEDSLTTRRRENIILSSLLFDKDCREFALQKGLDSGPFLDKQIKKVIDIFNSLRGSNIPPTLDMIVLQYFPKDEDEEKREKLKTKLFTLKNSCPPVDFDMFKQHLFFLKKHKALENLRKVVNKALVLINDEMNSPSYDKDTKTFDFLSEEFDQIMVDFTPEEVKSLNLAAGLKELITRIEEQRKNPSISQTVSSGYDDIDDCLSGGFRKGNFSLICARPAMGKTVFMLNQAINAAKKGSKVLFISIEMDLIQCLQRIMSNIADVKLKKILQPLDITDADIEQLKVAARQVSSLYGKNLFIEEVSSINVPQLGSKIKFYQKQFGVELIFVDYIQIMRTKGNKTPKEVSDFSEISEGLRELAKDAQVALVLGAQLSRDVEKRDDKRPMDSDLKNSGSFEQDAAAIIHLYRDVVYNKETEDKNIIEVIIGKNRFGSGNVTIKLPYDYSKQTIYQKSLSSAA